MANDGVDSSDEFEQLLRQCEDKAMPQADAQKVIDDLDQVNPNRPPTIDISFNSLQVLERGLDLPSSNKKRYLMSLLKICKVYGFVPTSHLVPDAELKKLSEAPFKSEGGYSMWPGSYKGQEVSINVLSRYVTDDEEAIRRRFCREVVIWKRMSHPNILPLIGVTLSEELAAVSPWTENGNITDYLRENRKANPVKLLEECALGLRYLHEVGIAHGGLQGRHILVTEAGHACLANIGHASIIREQGDPEDDSMSPTCGPGNLRYSPPEYSKGESALRPATRQGDIYSMGMTIYEVLTDKIPFHECRSWSVVLQIVKGVRPKEPDFTISRGYTEELWDLTTACWRPDPAERPTVDNLLEILGRAALQWKPGNASPLG